MEQIFKLYAKLYGKKIEHFIEDKKNTSNHPQGTKVIVKLPEHPVMKGVSQRFKIVDELYRWEKNVKSDIEVLAIDILV